MSFQSALNFDTEIRSATSPHKMIGASSAQSPCRLKMARGSPYNIPTNGPVTNIMRDRAQGARRSNHGNEDV
jgi:hypothetical protein